MPASPPLCHDHPDIAMVGSHAYGLFMDCERLPQPGESIIGWNFRRPDDGGKGSNQAICAGRLGAAVLFVGKVGEDPPADHLRDWFARCNVDARFLYRTRDRWRIDNVVITRGRQGVHARCGGETHELPAFAVEAVNTTGAGDAFAAGLVVALSRGVGWAGALEIGSAVAALSVQVDATWPS